MIRDRARQAMRAGGFATVTATLTALCAAHMARVDEAEKDTVRELWARRWASSLLALFTIDIAIRGSVPPPTRRGSDRGRLIVANHRSAIDIGVIIATFGGRLVSRADLADWPVLGAAARLGGTIFVDRADARSGMITMRTIQKHLVSGDTVTIFPEGTTFRGDEVQPFHGGAFIAAARAGAEILPVGIAYPAKSDAAFVGESFMQHLGRMAKASRRTHMAVSVGAPIDAKGKKATALTNEAHAAVQRAVGEARMLCGA